MPTEPSAAEIFADAATEWCQLVDRRADHTGPEFLVVSQPLLTRLHLQALALPMASHYDDPNEAAAVLMEEVALHMDKLARAAGQKREPGATVARGMTFDQWWNLYRDLVEQFRHEHHWVLADPVLPESPTPDGSSLADEIADIYRDVLAGLGMWNEGSYVAKERAVAFWAFTHSHHWGTHVLDSLRVIHHLTTVIPDASTDDPAHGAA